ncbi:hypothetical protein HII31_00083 [Pseudocercospora fuligena]|uniref:Uncharacterized protein n=1 Tax=Pseudocercospora fuligena TaxID=685502 RepID=A0A8H6VRX5_9PEZI|nr:hypothetical protein HII31_00083 [Pseudocercospora fuligena]
MGLEPKVDVFDEVWAIMDEREAARPVHVWKDRKEPKNAKDLVSRGYGKLPASEKKAYRKAMAALY